MKRKIIFFIATTLLAMYLSSSFCAYSHESGPEIYLIDYSEYCELLDNGTFPENMLTFDKISFMGDFKYFYSHSETGVTGAYRYLIKIANGNSFYIDIHPISKDFTDMDQYYYQYTFNYPHTLLFGAEHLDSDNVLSYSKYNSNCENDYTIISIDGLHYLYCKDVLWDISTVIPGYLLSFEFNALGYYTDKEDFVSELLKGNMTSERLAKLVSGEESLITTPSETTPNVPPEATTPEEQPKTGCAAFSFALPAFSAVLLAPIMIFIRKRII